MLAAEGISEDLSHTHFTVTAVFSGNKYESRNMQEERETKVDVSGTDDHSI